jgi:hypothetical protein
MFPNVRLMIVAISASLLAIACAMTLFMGLFAAFSVAHEPLSGFAAAKPPLQIAYADEISAPVADGKPAPFGVRFQLNAPQIPNGPVIVPVPAAIERVSPAEPPAPPEPVTNPAANAQSDVPAHSPSLAVLPHDDTQSPQPPLQEVPAAEPVQAATPTDDKAGEAKSDGIATDDTTATIMAPSEPPAPERPAAPIAPHHIAPQLRIVSREADNPASVATSPAPSLTRKGLKRRKLIVHLRQPHHFRRPRIHQTVADQGYAQVAGFAQPNAFGPSAMMYYTPSGYAQPSGFLQPGFGFTPAAIRPRPARWRHAVKSSSTTSQ